MDELQKMLRPGMIPADETKVVQNYITPVKHQTRANAAKHRQNLSSSVKVQDFLGEVQAIGTVRQPKMNKTEKAFAQLLDLKFKAGELLWWEYEPMNLRLGVKCYYRIDFMVMEKSGRLVAYEVKGKWEDDALVKIRTAAEKFPWPFIAVSWLKNDRGDFVWEYRKF